VHSRFHPARSFSASWSTPTRQGRVPGAPRDGADSPRLRRSPGRLLMSVDFNQLGLYVLAQPHQRSRAGRAAASARRHAPAHARGGARKTAARSPSTSAAGQGGELRDFAGRGRCALALQLGITLAKRRIHRPLRSPLRQVRAFQDEQFRLAKEQASSPPSPAALAIGAFGAPRPRPSRSDSQFASYANG